MLSFELVEVELFDDGLDLLIKLVVEVFVLEGSLIQLLVQATLLHSSVGHVVQLGQLHVVDRTLSLSQDLGQSR